MSTYNRFLGSKNTSSTNFFDFLFSNLWEEPSLDYDGLFGKVASAQDLEEAGTANVDDWGLRRFVCVLLSCSDTKDQILSRLIEGQYWFTWLGWTWKFLIPTFPK